MKSGSIKRNPPGGEHSGLPRVVGVKSARVRFDPPKHYYLKGRLVEDREAVELLVRTTGPLPILDLTPVLFIGDVPIADYETVGVNLYRFYAYELKRLPSGAPISLGWPYAPEAKIVTDFRFQLPNGPPIA